MKYLNVNECPFNLLGKTWCRSETAPCGAASEWQLDILPLAMPQFEFVFGYQFNIIVHFVRLQFIDYSVQPNIVYIEKFIKWIQALNPQFALLTDAASDKVFKFNLSQVYISSFR